MTNPTPLWPAPPPRRGAKIRHGWKCTRQADIEQTTRRDPETGAIVEVDWCRECGATDFAERVLSDPPGGEAA